MVTPTGRPSAVLIDVDGTLIAGGRPLPGAAELIEVAGPRAVLVSNDAEHTPADLSHRLRRLGLHVPADRIVLAGTAMFDLIRREYGIARILPFVSPALVAYARDIGLVPVVTGAEVVAVGRDRAFDFAGLAVAANAVRGGAALVAANPDRTHPGAGGSVVPETGALLAAILACVGPVAPRIVGKPEPSLFLEALSRLGAQPDEAVMIGDNPDTDGRGAHALGIAFHSAVAGLGPVLRHLTSEERTAPWGKCRVSRR